MSGRLAEMPKLTVDTSIICNPVVLTLGPVGLCFAAWALPPSQWVFHGWSDRTSVTFDAVLALAAFYLAIASAGWLASKVSFPNRSPRVDERTLERSLRVLAMLGVAVYSALLIQRVDVVAAVTELSANQLDEALPDEAGLQSLRYLVVPFGALSIARLLQRRVRLSYLGGIAALMFVGLAAGRLLFLMAFFSALTAIVAERRKAGKSAQVSLSIVKIGMVGAALFVVLLLLTYPRVAGTYASRGVTNPAAVTTASLVSYLSTPAQVQLAVANSIGKQEFEQTDDSIGPASDLILPTFLRSEGRDGKQHLDANHYGRGTDFRTNFTTNSVFADVLIERGLFGLFLVIVLAAVSTVAARLSFAFWPGVTGGLLAGPMLYPLTEVWRANVFLLGSQIAIIVAVFAALSIASPMVRMPIRGRKRHRTRPGTHLLVPLSDVQQFGGHLPDVYPSAASTPELVDQR
jgi:hypothetical protein